MKLKKTIKMAFNQEFAANERGKELVRELQKDVPDMSKVMALIAGGASLGQQDLAHSPRWSNHVSASTLAVAKGLHDVLGALISRKADLGVRSETYHDESKHSGVTLLMIAAKQGDLESARMLLEAKPDLLNEPSTHHGTALSHAARAGHAPMVTYLINQGAEITSEEIDDAIKSNNKEIIQLLLDVSAKTVGVSQHGIVSALASKNAEIVQMALDGAAVEEVNGYHIVRAVEMGDKAILQRLLNIITFISPSYQEQSIEDALRNGRQDMADMIKARILSQCQKMDAIVVAKENLDARIDAKGNTLLTQAMDVDNFELAVKLINAGASPWLQNEDKKNAFDLARECRSALPEDLQKLLAAKKQEVRVSCASGKTSAPKNN